MLQAGTYTWNNAGSSWFSDANWDGDAGFPGNGDTATVNSGTILLTNDTGYLSSLTMNGGTLVMSNWSTTLSATNIDINATATVTLPNAFNNVAMSNRLHFVCGNFTLATGATINVQGRGYAGGNGTTTTNDGYGPGAGQVVGSYYGGGGGNGGAGNDGCQGTGGVTNGSASSPLNPGSGGAGNAAASGGGAIRIEATGTITINGTINASGNDSAAHGGGGSGGSIFLSCALFRGGAAAKLQADGGDCVWYSPTQHGGGAGGGRIAVAAGMSPVDLQRLVNGLTVTNLLIYNSHAGYQGTLSVTNGIAMFGATPIEAPGTPGTTRFVTTSSAAKSWLLVRGDPGSYGTPAPYPNGINPGIANGTRITNTVATPVTTGTGIRRACIGWIVTNQVGNVISNRAGNQAVFTMTTNLILTYRWTNVYQVAVTPANPAQGSVNSATVNGWYTNGVATPNIIATASNGYAFNRWIGAGIPPGKENDNPLTVTMTAPLLIAAHFGATNGEVRTWTGTGNWTNSARWSPVGIPGPKDEARIASGTVTVSEPMSAGKVVITNGAVVLFTNWSARLTASNVTIRGTVTLPGNFRDNVMSNRVHIVCTNLAVVPGGIINADAAGYAGGWSYATEGYGPGKGRLTTTYYGGGGGHGGVGGDGICGIGGITYDVTNAPTQPGSGGGGNIGGSGGGAVLIDAQGMVTVDGTITADGGTAIPGAHGGGGSGGSILLFCGTFQGGTGGVLRTRGGNANFFSPSQYGGGGGGGRIAVGIGISNTDRQTLMAGGIVSNLVVYYEHGDYAGSLSVTNGTDGQGHAGAPGTWRYVQKTSDSRYWLKISGTPANYGSASPRNYGFYGTLAIGQGITNTVTSPVDEGGGIGRACVSWFTTNKAGAVVSNGTGKTAVFNMTTNLVLTYRWTNVYQLIAASANSAQGSVNAGTVNGWYSNGTVVANISATVSNGYSFNRWTGAGVPPGKEKDNPLGVTMTGPLLITANFGSLTGEVRTWMGTGNWIEPALWSPTGIPGPRDDARILSGTVTLSESMTANALTVTNGAIMVFTNWSTRFTAPVITVRGTVTLPGDFTDAKMSNRVCFSCRSFRLADTGIIAANAMGYDGGWEIWQEGQGPGKGRLTGSYYGGGGGHGGTGGNGCQGIGGVTNGLVNAPLNPGSGGAGTMAGSGGGAVRIDATGLVTLDGLINADAGNSLNHGGGGSGGSIFIACKRFAGAATGQMRARGGNSNYWSPSQHGGGGGGGRIAVAIGVSAPDIQRLVTGQPVGHLRVETTYADYLGTLSVTNGTDGNVPDGFPGTYRFLIAPPDGVLLMVE